MTWVANELVLYGQHHFFLECMRLPPDWHIWLYYLVLAPLNYYNTCALLKSTFGQFDVFRLVSLALANSSNVIFVHY